MKIFKRLGARAGHLHVAHAGIEHNTAFHPVVSTVGKRLRTSATMTAECNKLHIDITIIRTLFITVLRFGPIHSQLHVLGR